MAKRSNRILLLIGLFNLVKALGLVAVGLGALSLLHRDEARGVKGWIDNLHPANRYIREAIEKVSGFDPATLRLIGIGTLVYACFFLVEGIGLLMKKLWAEYFTTILTASFIPLEIYELVEKESVTKGAVIAFNIGIVVYLVLRLRADGNWPFRRADIVAA